ncbi:membrane protein [Fulvitalea axinellae]|uniref:Membrane protein n=1 Tax=Fulvitalea axinellae TaxID=1182444 RepID=A0AAU9CXQ5_9BACT|nr:membrane protein [Fulvitalea axinellae]
MLNTDLLRAINSKLALIVTVLCAYLLMKLQAIILPLVLAVFVGLLLEPIINGLRKKKVPFFVSILLVLALHAIAIYLFTSLITETVNQIIEQKNTFGEKITEQTTSISNFVEKVTNGRLIIKNWIDKPLDMINTRSLINITGAVLNEVGKVSEVIGLAAIYLIFMLYSIINHERYLMYLGGTEQKGLKMIEDFKLIKKSVIQYIKVKTLASLANGLIFYLCCTFFNVDFALFWGIFAFFLYFLPNIGAITVSILVGILALLQIPSFSLFLVFFSILIVFQFVTTNLVEPKYLGDWLALNPITVLIGLIVWGYLWGIIGMLLAVPLMVLIKSILARFPEYQVLVKLMSRKADH